MFSRAPTFDVFGSLFPVWLPCIAAAILLTLAARYLLIRAGLDGYLGPRVVVYPGLAVLLACSIWLLFFNY
jgi:hypothetical protein